MATIDGARAALADHEVPADLISKGEVKPTDWNTALDERNRLVRLMRPMA